MLPTIQVPIISSVHGRKRRLEREITKEELQAAVKYGKKEATYTNGILRWKYSFADIVYISDETSSVEVTCYTVEKPMGRVVISERLAVQYDEANLLITKRPKIITSHTVLIVDLSGSMRKSDMNGHKTRAKGVYYTIAEDFIASRLHPAELGSLGGGEVTYTDVVTLIEMRSTATVVFEFEPISWQLYNRFIDLHDSNRMESTSSLSDAPSTYSGSSTTIADALSACSSSRMERPAIASAVSKLPRIDFHRTSTV